MFLEELPSLVQVGQLMLPGLVFGLVLAVVAVPAKIVTELVWPRLSQSFRFEMDYAMGAIVRQLVASASRSERMWIWGYGQIEPEPSSISFPQVRNERRHQQQQYRCHEDE